MYFLKDKIEFKLFADVARSCCTTFTMKEVRFVHQNGSFLAWKSIKQVKIGGM